MPDFRHFITCLAIALAYATGMDAQNRIFSISEIPDSIFAKMKGKSWSTECTTKRSDLRFLKVSHYDEQGASKQGELICHKLIAKALVNVFKELYEAHYPIHSVKLIDEYDGNDELSMRDNNTSCFNYRLTSRGTPSKHALGMAIDINPLWNPCVHLAGKKAGTIEPKNATEYKDRTYKGEKKRGMRNVHAPRLIDRNDVCYKIFMKHGFRWGGAWKTIKDYQHFEK